MTSFILRTLLLSCTLACASASATVYNYTGNTLDNGDHVTASADVSFSGAGSYVIGSGLNSFQLNWYDAANTLRLTMNSSDAGTSSAGYVNYMRFDALENVTSWFLLNYTNNAYMYTLGNDFGAPSNCNCGSQEFTSRYAQLTNVGTWTAAAVVPEPGSLALLGLGLAGLGFSKRKKQLATQA